MTRIVGVIAVQPFLYFLHAHRTRAGAHSDPDRMTRDTTHGLILFHPITQCPVCGACVSGRRAFLLWKEELNLPSSRHVACLQGLEPEMLECRFPETVT